jgi:leader peptidase (prepilin peptidase) / N-methyltransferase
MTKHALVTKAPASCSAKARRRDNCCIAAGAIAASVFAAVGNHAVASIAVLACVAPMIIGTDLRERRIPTPLIQASAVILAIAVSVTAATGQPSRALHATIGLVVVGGVFLAVHLASPRGIGYGDVRLAALTATAVAYGTGASVAVACAVVATAASGLSCLLRREQSAPFAAFLLPAALVAIAGAALNH